MSENVNAAKADDLDPEAFAEPSALERRNTDQSWSEPVEGTARQEAPHEQHRGKTEGAAPNPAKRLRRRDGPLSPISTLSAKEAELKYNESCRGRLGRAISASPDVNILAYQLTGVAKTSGLGGHIAGRMRNEGVSLYAALDPVDPIDSMIARQLVALHYAVMESFRRAMKKDDAKVRDMELRNAIRELKAFEELLKLREAHRKATGRTVTIDLDPETSNQEPRARPKRVAGRKLKGKASSETMMGHVAETGAMNESRDGC